MALDNTKSGFGFDMEERLKKVATPPTQTSTQTFTSTSKEYRTERLYITTKPSIKQALEIYAERTDDKVNNLVNMILEEWIEKNV